MVAGALTGAAPVRADAPACATTYDPATPATASPGSPCWVDVTPYPFGIDGTPVDPSAPYCLALESACYLQVDSLAFRAWNRGLAAVSPPPNIPSGGTTPFGVWRYNGTRWYPDPTFPGQSVCQGTTVLWAGKLDYWLIGGTASTTSTAAGKLPQWPELCRYDGVDDVWEPLAVPAATAIQAELEGQTLVGITAGACFAWNNCWFFGTGGVVVHWDGQSLSNVSAGLGTIPHLEASASYTDALAGTNAGGTAFGMAVAASNRNSEPVSPAPQMFTSAGEAFSPAAFPIPAVTEPTDLVAVSADARGDAWVAGNPDGVLPGAATDSPQTFCSRTNCPNLQPVQPAPLAPISSRGAALPCPADTPADEFMYYARGSATSYLWTSIGVMPGGDAIAGGWVGSNGSGTEPVLAQVSCSGPPVLTSFVDPTTGDAVDPGGYVSAIAANAVNDVWAATSDSQDTFEPPQLYQLTDGQAPLAPAGNDHESRPVVAQQEPTIFQFSPPVTIQVQPPPRIVKKPGKRKRKKVTLPSPVYDLPKVPRLVQTGTNTFVLTLTFRVHGKVTIGLEALHGTKVISASGLKTFNGGAGSLSLRLDRDDWPTGLKFVLPTKRK